MDIPNNSWRQAHKRPKLLIYSLILSLILHVAVVLILPLFNTEERLPEERPTIVRLVEKPTPPEKQQTEQKPDQYEIDQQPTEPLPVKPVESFRKAERDQKVPKEQAPEGIDDRDQSTVPQPVPLPRPVQPPVKEVEPVTPLKPEVQTKPTPQPTPKVSKPKQKTAVETTGRAPEKPQSVPVPAPPPAPEPLPQPAAPAPPPTLTPQQLLPDRNTLDNIVTAEPGTRARIKKRDGVDIGDTVWLNLQHDLLVSFFRRFHDQIERVWNYPTEAVEKGLEGTLLLWITVSKEGELIDVDLQRSSGSDLLDFEAIQAIYRAAPFGPLSKYYPHDKLTIRAHFRYDIVGKYIYGKP